MCSGGYTEFPMAEVPLYPWYLRSTIYVLKGFDQNWFTETADGLMPKNVKDPIFCLTDEHEWDMCCELPHPISTSEVQIQLGKEQAHISTLSTSSVPSLLPDGAWQGTADFQLILRESPFAERFIEERWNIGNSCQMHS